MAYPATVSLQHQPQSSRLWALLTMLMIRMIMLIPHFIVLMFVAIASFFALLIGPLGVLFNGQYPMWAEKLVVGLQQWTWRITAYAFCLSDKYPPFDFEMGSHPAQLDFKHQQQNSRWWALGTIFFPVKAIALIPHLILLWIMSYGLMFCLFLMPLLVLFMGRTPQPLENFIVGYHRWQWRVNAFFLAVTDQYPPFSLD